MEDQNGDEDKQLQQEIQSILDEADKYQINNDSEQAINLYEKAVDMIEQSSKVDETLVLETLKKIVDVVQFQRQFQDRYLVLLIKFYDHAVEAGHRIYAVQAALYIKNVYISLQKETEVIKWQNIEKEEKDKLQEEIKTQSTEDKEKMIKATKCVFLKMLIDYDYKLMPEVKSKYTSMDKTQLFAEQQISEQHGNLDQLAVILLQQLQLSYKLPTKEEYISQLSLLSIKIYSESQGFIENMNLRKLGFIKTKDMLLYILNFIASNHLESSQLLMVYKYLQMISQQQGLDGDAIKYGQLYTDEMDKMKQKQAQSLEATKNQSALMQNMLQQMSQQVPQCLAQQQQLQKRVEYLEKEVVELKTQLIIVTQQLQSLNAKKN